MLVHDTVSFTLFFFFFNDTATTEIYTLSLHDALPISRSSADEPRRMAHDPRAACPFVLGGDRRARAGGDRKSTRLNSSHGYISYAVFCLKKKTRPPAPPARPRPSRPEAWTLSTAPPPP